MNLERYITILFDRRMTWAYQSENNLKQAIESTTHSFFPNRNENQTKTKYVLRLSEKDNFTNLQYF